VEAAVQSSILIIDDDTKLGELLFTYLAGHGFRAKVCADAAAGIAALRAEPFDGVILDVMLPDADGFEVCKRIRALPAPLSKVPIVMLTARGEEADRIVGLELGADDYLPKPFSPRELVARLRAAMRRATWTTASTGEVLRFGRLEIDLDAREVRVSGVERKLTGHQYELLVALARRPGRVLSRDQLMEAVRGHELEAFDRSIDVHISRIRAAIEEDPQNPKLVLTVRGAGYVLAPRGGE
jgi:DNA-binding response OmpR family regulator